MTGEAIFGVIVLGIALGITILIGVNTAKEIKIKGKNK